MLRAVRYRHGEDERPGSRTSHSMLRRLKQRYEPQLSRLGGSDTAKAAGLAGAMVANNVIALGSVIVFSRLLTDYGSLAALVSYFLILAVVGLRDAAGDRARGRTRPPRGRAGPGRHDPELDEVAAGVHRGDDGDLDPRPPPDRRGRRRQAAVGGGARDPGRLPLPDAVHPARLPPGARRLSSGRHQPGRRAGRPAGDRRRPRRRRARNHRRLHRNSAVVRRDDGVLRGAAPPAAGRGRAGKPPGGSAVGSRAGGVGGDRRARDHRGAPEHRHHRRQAPLLLRPGELLQRHGGRSQGPHLGRDGRRLLPGARGLAQAFGRRGWSSSAGQGARDRRRRRRPVPA